MRNFSRTLDGATRRLGRARTGWLFGVLAATASGCGGHSGGGGASSLPSFRDVSDAPAAIQKAARAVVRIGTAGEFATGSFISPSGLLLTNNHVLGVDICPAEGCYAQLTYDYERGSPPSAPVTVYVVAVTIDIGLDMAVMQAYVSQGGATVSSPDYLTIVPRDPTSLLGTHINVVGHPEGHLKKWTEGEIVDAEDDWIFFSAYGLPGNSGSPVLDDDGDVVGILHRGPESQDLIAQNTVDEYEIGTASASLSAAMGEALPASLWSVDASAMTADVVDHEDVYLNAQTANADVGGVSTPVLSSLGAACDAALAVTDYASPDDLAAGLAPCTDAEGWIDCRTDMTAGGFSQCPTADIAAWQTRDQSVFAQFAAMGAPLPFDEVSFALAALSPSVAVGKTAAVEGLESALTSTGQILDFTVVNYLAAFGVASYQGTDLLAFVQNYKSFPDYALSATSIASSALWYNQNALMTETAALSILTALDSDPSVDVGSKLYLEDVLYQSGVLH